LKPHDDWESATSRFFESIDERVVVEVARSLSPIEAKIVLCLAKQKSRAEIIRELGVPRTLVEKLIHRLSNALLLVRVAKNPARYSVHPLLVKLASHKLRMFEREPKLKEPSDEASKIMQELRELREIENMFHEVKGMANALKPLVALTNTVSELSYACSVAVIMSCNNMYLLLDMRPHLKQLAKPLYSYFNHLEFDEIDVKILELLKEDIPVLQIATTIGLTTEELEERLSRLEEKMFLARLRMGGNTIAYVVNHMFLEMAQNKLGLS